MDPLKHYPVTTTFYRGHPSGPTIGKLRRACDWAPTQIQQCSLAFPTCADCVAYRDQLKRVLPIIRQWKEARPRV